MTLTLANNPMKDMHYTVRLYFAEPENIREGERIFDISIQGTFLLKNFDILKEIGQPHKIIIKEFKAHHNNEYLNLKYVITNKYNE